MATTYTLEDGTTGQFDQFVKAQNFSESFEKALLDAAGKNTFGGDVKFAFESENDGDGAPGPEYQGILFKGAEGGVNFGEALGQKIVFFDGDKGIDLSFESARSMWIAATGGSDTITVDSSAFEAMVIGGGAGDDKIITGDGADSVFGGDGDDRLYTGAGADYAEGGAGDDRLAGDDGNDTLLGGDGNDRLQGGAGRDDLDGGDGDDRVSGGDGSDLIHGGLGNDDLDGGGGNDTIYADDGQDSVSGGAGNDEIYGGTGNSELAGGGGADDIYAGSGDSTLVGGDGNDNLYGGMGDSVFDGGKGNDHIELGLGDATVTGGSGNDEVILGDGDAQISLGLGNDTFSVAGEGYATVSGGAGADVFDMTGGEGDYVVSGDAGEDLFLAGDGSATIDGGSGFDVANFAGDRPDFSFDAATGTWDLGMAGEMSNVEYAQFGDGSVLITVQNGDDAQVARLYQIISDSDPSADQYKSMLDAFTQDHQSIEDIIISQIDSSMADSIGDETLAIDFLDEKFANLGVDTPPTTLYDTLKDGLTDGTLSKAQAVAAIAQLDTADDDIGIKIHSGLV